MPCATHMADFDFGDVIGATELITFAYEKHKLERVQKWIWNYTKR